MHSTIHSYSQQLVCLSSNQQWVLRQDDTTFSSRKFPWSNSNKRSTRLVLNNFCMITISEDNGEWPFSVKMFLNRLIWLGILIKYYKLHEIQTLLHSSLIYYAQVPTWRWMPSSPFANTLAPVALVHFDLSPHDHCTRFKPRQPIRYARNFPGHRSPQNKFYREC